MKPAIYVRVSPGAEQDTAMQISEIQAYIKARGWTGEWRLFEDKWYTGKDMLRPAFQRLYQEIREAKVDTVIVWKIDRLGRSLRDLVLTMDDWKEREVRLISLRDGIDLGTAQGRMMFGLLATLAEYEREMILERVKAGIAHAKEHGTKSGKPFGPPIRHDRTKRQTSLFFIKGINLTGCVSGIN